MLIFTDSIVVAED